MSSIEPREVIDLVEDYVYRELRNAEQYENSTPLDESGIYGLHRLAREIYALGVRDGVSQEVTRTQRQLDRQRKEAAADKADAQMWRSAEGMLGKVDGGKS